MKHRRSWLHIQRVNGAERARSIALGEWHIHYGVFGSLSVSHQSGLLARDDLTPLRAVRLARALSALPPAPVAASVMILVAKKQCEKPVELEEWFDELRAALAALDAAREGE